MIAARKFISDLLFIKYLVLRWEINIRKGERDRTGGEKKKAAGEEGQGAAGLAGRGRHLKEDLHLPPSLLGQREKACTWWGQPRRGHRGAPEHRQPPSHACKG